MANSPALDVHFASGPGAGALQDLLYAELDDYNPLAIQELEHPGGWRVFFRTARERNAARLALESGIGGHVLELSAVTVDDEDWASRTQTDLKAIHIGSLTVAPPWDASPGAIVINPSTGFGTGHHATTRLCLELLQATEVAGRRVIDVGTGSGLLAIAAWKLGAASVVGVDNDPEALHNARENVTRNRAGQHVELVEADLSVLSVPGGDIVLANLTGPVLQRYVPELMGLANPGATTILSGFAPEDIDAIAAGWIGWSVRDRRCDGEWAALALCHTP